MRHSSSMVVMVHYTSAAAAAAAAWRVQVAELLGPHPAGAAAGRPGRGVAAVGRGGLALALRPLPGRNAGGQGGGGERGRWRRPCDARRGRPGRWPVGVQLCLRAALPGARGDDAHRGMCVAGRGACAGGPRGRGSAGRILRARARMHMSTCATATSFCDVMVCGGGASCVFSCAARTRPCPPPAHTATAQADFERAFGRPGENKLARMDLAAFAAAVRGLALSQLAAPRTQQDAQRLEELQPTGQRLLADFSPWFAAFTQAGHAGRAGRRVWGGRPMHVVLVAPPWTAWTVCTVDVIARVGPVSPSQPRACRRPPPRPCTAPAPRLGARSCCCPPWPLLQPPAPASAPNPAHRHLQQQHKQQPGRSRSRCRRWAARTLRP